MEFFVVLWSILGMWALYRIITSAEQFIDRWLRVKEGRPLKEDIINYYPQTYEWTMFRKDRKV